MKTIYQKSEPIVEGSSRVLALAIMCLGALLADARAADFKTDALAKQLHVLPHALVSEQLKIFSKLPASLAFSQGTRSLTAGQSGTISVELRSVSGELVAALQPIKVVLQSGSDHVSLTIPAGEKSRATSMLFAQPGTRVIQASSSGLKSASLFVNVLPPRSVAPVAPKRPSIKLYTESPRIRANGLDSVNLHAFLSNGANSGPQGITLQFLPVQGIIMSPEKLVIPPGSDSGRVEIKSRKHGHFTIECRPVNPEVDFDGGRQVTLDCDVDDYLFVDVNTNVSLLNEIEVTVSFHDRQGILMTNSAARPVAIALDGKDIGSFRTNLTVTPDSPVATTSFRPRWVGTGEIEADSGGFQRQTATVRVSFPWPQAFTVLIAGAVGGLIAAWRQHVSRRNFWWRVMAGGVTGCALCLGGVVGALGGHVREISVTLFGLLLLALLGGYLGTEVFTLLLKRLGLVSGDAKESAESEDEPKNRGKSNGKNRRD